MREYILVHMYKCIITMPEKLHCLNLIVQTDFLFAKCFKL